MLDSLVRVSRRVDKKYFVKVFSYNNSKNINLSYDDFNIPLLLYKKRLTYIKYHNYSHANNIKYIYINTISYRFHFSNFRYSLTLFSKFFASFPHGTCSLSVSHQYLALDGIYHPLRAAIPSNSTL